MKFLFAFTACLLYSCFASYGQAFSLNELNFQVNSARKTVTIVRSYSTSSDLTIPNTVDYLGARYNVDSIRCIIREFLGSGSFGKGLINTVEGVIGTGDGLQIFSSEFGAKVLTMPFGGFLTLGVLIAAMQFALRKSAEKKEKEGNK